MWAQGFGAWGHLSGDGNAAALERSIGGFVMGADTKVTDNFALGLMGGYGRTGPNVADRASSATPNNTHFAICRAALELDLHVVCEEPLCFTVVGAEPIICGPLCSMRLSLKPCGDGSQVWRAGATWEAEA